MKILNFLLENPIFRIFLFVIFVIISIVFIDGPVRIVAIIFLSIDLFLDLYIYRKRKIEKKHD